MQQPGCVSFLNADKIENFADFIAKVPEEIQRQGYVLHRVAVECICFIYHYNSLFVSWLQILSTVIFKSPLPKAAVRATIFVPPYYHD